MVAPGLANAAEETTTTTEAPATTIPESSTTTTVAESSTTTIPSSTTTSVGSSPTTTIPGDSTTTTLDPEIILEPDPLPPDPEPPAADFVVGHRRPPAIVFPLAGEHSFANTFGAPRDGGRRRHAGIDIFAEKGVPVLAVGNGVVEKMGVERLAGQYVVVRHDNGWRSKYLHLNNDTPGTEDGLALGYEEGLAVGDRVVAGTVIGYVGNSGNAESTAPHLHFSLHQPDRLPVNPYRALVAAPEVAPIYPKPVVSTFNTELVGFLDADRAGFNAGLALGGDHVFMGTWGNERTCPGTGVRVIDVSKPSNPLLMTRLATGEEYPGTATDSLWVGYVETPWFAGRIAVVAVWLCDPGRTTDAGGRFAGLLVYDVTAPQNPVLLSKIHSGDDTNGVKDLDVVVDNGGRVLAAATVPGSYLGNPDGIGDVRLYELTNPRLASRLSDWDLRRDAPLLLAEGLKARFGLDDLDATTVSWAEPDRLLISSVGTGLVTLDVGEPTAPRYLGALSALDTYDLVFGPPDIDAPELDSVHGWMLDGSTLVQDDERLEQVGGDRGGNWGQQVLYDISNPARPSILATFGTESSHPGLDGVVERDGLYSPRESSPLDDGSQVVAWMSDGARVVDLSDPAHPVETGYFVPPPRRDPHRSWVAPDGSTSFPLAWDVATDGDLVYMVDVNSGLWVFRVTQPLLQSVPRLE
jgi:murein DD-endopeptidase MepM/ murein hydrolase activator NlpD